MLVWADFFPCVEIRLRKGLVKMSKHLQSTLVLLCAPMMLQAAARASPSVSTYVTSGTLTTSVVRCLDEMKGIAVGEGFTESQELLMDKNKNAGDFHSDNKSLSMHFTARCNNVSKTWGMAVSGIEAANTFAKFKVVADLFQKQ